jgi:fatty-acid desaturase
MFLFTIRDVLWLTALVAIGAGWWIDHQQFTPEDREFLRWWNANAQVIPVIAPTPAPDDN